MKHKLLSLLLALSLLATMLPPVYATDTIQYTGLCGGETNPLYVDVPEPECTTEYASTAYSTATTTVYVSLSTAAAQLRDAMVARQSQITLYISTDDFWYTSSSNNWIAEKLIPTAYSQNLAQSGYDGDYLRWSWMSYSWQILSQSGNCYAIKLSLYYYTTAEEEATLSSAIDALTESLNLESLSAYDQCAAIYDYITANVTYDYASLNAIYDNDPSNDDYHIFTAYGALINGTAVCQGYAALFYAMCYQVGLPVRIITSTNHAWNLVRLKAIWYNADSTWDSLTETGREWFLLGMTNFAHSSHDREEEYTTVAFTTAYPTSTLDYDTLSPYNDVSPNSTHYSDILRATSLGLFKGTSTYTFSPKMVMTRAMLVTVLWRMEGSPSANTTSAYSDVRVSSYYAQAVSWATENAIVYGVGDGKFNPNGEATREQVTTILYRYASYLNEDTSPSADLSGYRDSTSVSNYAKSAVQWAVATGLVKGTSSTTLSPKDSATREQLASLLIRLIDYYGLE